MTDTWLNEPLLVPEKGTPHTIVEAKRLALLSEFRNFTSFCQVIDVSVTEIGVKGWKSAKDRPGYALSIQQERYGRLCLRKDALLLELNVLECQQKGRS